jgi:pyruvate formate lyase activating enzyme
MHEALHYKKIKNKTVQCHLCPKFCLLKQGERGNCRARKNINGNLISLVYARPCSIAIDPIEKKPLFHFLPGSAAYSLGTAGCNLHCQWCQNWEISQSNPEDIPSKEIEPEQIVQNAIDNNCKTIAYTYTEPTIFYEYVLDTAKIARKNKIKNVTVTSAYINKEPLNKLYRYIDGTNIDFKGFTEQFYKKYCFATLQPVLDAIKEIHKIGVWIELTNLVIPTINDDLKKIKEISLWIKNNLGTNIPLHFSAFYPCYKMMNLPRTSPDILLKARQTALKTGLNYVYVGNVMTEEAENTYCPKCKELLIERKGFSITKNNIKNRKCPKCKTSIPGVWA